MESNTDENPLVDMIHRGRPVRLQIPPHARGEKRC